MHSDSSRLSTNASCMASAAGSHMLPVNIVQRKKTTATSILQRPTMIPIMAGALARLMLA